MSIRTPFSPVGRRAAWACLLVLIASGVCARAQTAPLPSDLTRLSLDELLGVEFDKVYGASRFVQDIRRAPASVTIVSAEDIERHGYRTVAEAVESASSFYATSDRNYSEIGVRGFGRPGDYNTRVLVLIDGHRLNDNIYDAAYLGTEFPIDIGLVERIEIIRGPRSSVYGSNAFFAVINVLTRQGRSVGRGEIAGAAGNLGAARGRVTVGQKTPKAEWLFSGSGYRRAGYHHLYFPEFDSPATNNGIAVDRDGENLQQVFGKAAFGGFAVEGAWSRRFKAIPTASFGSVFNDPREQTIDGRSFINVEYGKTLSRQTDMLVRAYLDHVAYEGHYPAPWYVNPSIISLQDDEGHGEGAGADWLLTSHFGPRHGVTAGVEFFGDLRQVQFVSESADPLVLTVDERHHAQRWSVFGQDEITIGPHVTLDLGLRYDWHSTFGGATSPRLGLILAPSTRSTIKLLYGTAYRAPSAYELYYDTHGLMHDLMPERIRTSEIVAEQRFGERVKGSATFFDYRIENLINQIDEPNAIYGFGFVNIARATAQGVELSAEARSGEYRLRVGQTIERVRDRDSNMELSNAPRYLTRIGAVVPLLGNRAFLGLDGDYLSRRSTLQSDVVGARYLQHVNVSAPRAIGNLDLGILVRNLFDTGYSDPASADLVQDAITQDGRTFQVRATYHF